MGASAEVSERAIRRCVELYNRRTAEWVDTCYAVDAEWTELPTPATPRGRGGKRGVLRAAAERALALFPDLQMKIRNLVAQGQQVGVELEWSGTAAAAVGSVKPGTAVRLRIASFFTVVDGLITKHTDYCVPDSGQ
ncbi:MAG: nuclear transport factor 2 family protein [Terriglobia bacterium]